MTKAVGTPVIISADGATRQLERITLTQNDVYDERWLQKLIFKNPSLLPMDQIEPGLSRLIPVCMELSLHCGSLDNLFLTPEGDVVIVEVKLWRNSEMRRAVLAQALDYASALFSMSYEELDNAVRKADGADGRSMFEIVDEQPDTLDESGFQDALINRLKTGRIVVIVAGDGIRGELENLVARLQAHAVFRFTFALVELALFRLSDGEEDLVVVPTTLAQTYMIERGVIRLEGDSVAASFEPAAPNNQSSASPEKTAITPDEFFDAMRDIDADLPRQIEEFLEKVKQYGVYHKFERSMILRWDTPAGDTAQLGCIYRNGSVIFEDVASSLPSTGKQKQAAECFLADLAKQHDDLELVDWHGGKTLRVNGKPPKIGQFAKNPDGFVIAVSALDKSLRDQ